MSYLDPFGLSRNWHEIRSGSAQLAGGLLGATSASFAIIHGMNEIAVGIENDPNNIAAQQFVDIFPSNPGELLGLPFGQNTEHTAGLIWDVATLRFSSGPELYNSLGSGERVGLNATQFGLDAFSLGADIAGLSHNDGSDDGSEGILGNSIIGNIGIGNPGFNTGFGISNPFGSIQSTPDWISSVPSQDSTSTGKI